MKTAKIISFLAFLSNTFSVLIIFLIIFQRSNFTYKDFQMPSSFLWNFLVALIFAIGNLAFWFYLNNKEKKGEKVKFALEISIVLLLVSHFVVGRMIVSFLQSIYEQMGSIQ